MAESESTPRLASETVETAVPTKSIEEAPPASAGIQVEAAGAADSFVKSNATELKTTLDGLQNEKEPVKEDQIAAPAKVQADDLPAIAKPPTDAELLDELLRYLEEDTFTMDVTERQLRSRLEKHFGVPLKDKKTIIRDKIMDFIQAKQDLEEADAAEGKEEPAQGEDDVAISEEEEEDQPVKKKRKGGGLNASCRLSEPLQAFLGEESMSRPQVVKALWAYIRENDLQDPSNKRKIILDEKLATLFTKPLDMFSMNRQLSKHVKTNDGPKGVPANGEEAGPSSTTPKPKRKAEASAEKPAKKSKSSSTDTGAAKKPNAFTRPLKVSPELSEWLGGQESISRPQLTKYFWAYAKEKNLLNPQKKSIINCDEALKNLTGEDSFACFGFAKYFKRHLLGYADVPAE